MVPSTTIGVYHSRAQVINISSFTREDIVNLIMAIGAGLTRSDAVSVIEALKQVIVKILADGGAVNTELFNTYPSISGVFDSPDAPFDPTKNKVHIKLQPGTALRAAVAEIRTKRVAAVVTGTAVTDLKTDAGETLSPPDPRKPFAGFPVAGIDTERPLIRFGREGGVAGGLPDRAEAVPPEGRTGI
jgi:hypothetical protein